MRVPACERHVSRHGSFDRYFSTVSDVQGAEETRPALLVSSCLLGTRCNHEAGHSRRAAVEELARTHRLVPVCPEVCGGLSTPRPAAERVGERVMNGAGEDVTDA